MYAQISKAQTSREDRLWKVLSIEYCRKVYMNDWDKHSYIGRKPYSLEYTMK